MWGHNYVARNDYKNDLLPWFAMCVSRLLWAVAFSEMCRNHIGHNYIRRNYIRHNYTRHNYICHNYVCHNYIEPQIRRAIP